MAARGRTAAAAAAAASRCRSRCELRQAAGSCRRASLVRRAQAAGSTALLPAGRGRAGCLGRRSGGLHRRDLLRCLRRCWERQQGARAQHRRVGAQHRRVLSSHRDPPQVQLGRRLDWVAYALWRRLAASERARRPCCCGAALQLAGGGAGCAAAVARSGPPVPSAGGYRWPRATRAPGSIRGLSMAPGGAPERGRGMA